MCEQPWEEYIIFAGWVQDPYMPVRSKLVIILFQFSFSLIDLCLFHLSISRDIIWKSIIIVYLYIFSFETIFLEDSETSKLLLVPYVSFCKYSMSIWFQWKYIYIFFVNLFVGFFFRSANSLVCFISWFCFIILLFHLCFFIMSSSFEMIVVAWFL